MSPGQLALVIRGPDSGKAVTLVSFEKTALRFFDSRVCDRVFSLCEDGWICSAEGIMAFGMPGYSIYRATWLMPLHGQKDDGMLFAKAISSNPGKMGCLP